MKRGIIFLSILIFFVSSLYSVASVSFEKKDKTKTEQVHTVTFSGINTANLRIKNIGFSEVKPTLDSIDPLNFSVIAYDFANGVSNAKAISTELPSPLNQSKLGFSIYLFYGLWYDENLELQLGYSNFLCAGDADDNHTHQIMLNCDIQELTQDGWPDNAAIVSVPQDFTNEARIKDEVATQIFYGDASARESLLRDTSLPTLLTYKRSDVRKWGYMKLSFYTEDDLIYKQENVSAPSVNISGEQYYSFITVKVVSNS